jgi:formylmethanofuran dehydrogenase subunit E
MIDAYDLWAAHDAEQEAELLKLPECDYCGSKIQDDHFFLINDESICEGCLNDNFRKAVDDYVQ